jgi:hypothetical protein
MDQRGFLSHSTRCAQRVEATATYEVFVSDMYGGVCYLRNFGIMSQRVHESCHRGGTPLFFSGHGRHAPHMDGKGK